MIRTLLILATLVAHANSAGASDSAATDEQRAWTQEKCVRYQRAWHDMTGFVGLDGATDGFIKGNEKFIAEGCSTGADVCPQSPQDIKLANALTMAAMNFGTASSFLPFICRQR